MSAALYPHHPYGIPVIGWQEEIESFTADDALGFYHRWYNPANAVVVVSGDVKPAEVFALAKQYFGPLATAPKITRTRVQTPDLPGDIRLNADSDAVHERLVEVATRMPSYRVNTDMAYALEVLEEILDGSEASYLPKTLVQEKKLVSHVDVDYSPGSFDETAFTISAIPAAGQTDDAVLAGLKEALANAAKMITTEEMARAKQSLQRSSIFARDSIMSPAYVLGGALATDRTVADAEAWPDKIAAVTPEQVQKALQMLINSRHVAGTIHPTGKALAGGSAPPPRPQGALQ
jgi:zinc protease